ncbi:adenine phosphoribosyltransferase [Alkaliphilus oremlandii]|uniref:Adenine phosphoribosyltransferase n=1 Tax=Alkaliphilus oremlandii (strain OhILAs) TaxID=350688 RepID=APT_ALKOO|nr:adenine phosphoribosyltransferase [Alkaliphilus oremlandii]A8MGN2.1 RecName: Full=Adenine phosphoribosyltransferase; Short=APRT [Alkaliphilus oremlandii OhILAs]ABW19255.1 adenine phosphoribosyltransferase [Alkaliphilus oremlandii OhILAs]
MDLKSKIRQIEGFPKEGISFKDITTVLKEGEALQYVTDQLTEQLKDLNIDIIVGPEARGFLVGTPVAYKLGVGFVPVRKPGKLPAETLTYEYELEYGTDSLQIHKDSIRPGQRVAIVDDLLATGGTVLATAKMVEALGGQVVSMNFLIELTGLKGRDILKGYEIKSLVEYEF